MIHRLTSTVRPSTRARALLAPQYAAFQGSLRRARRRYSAEEVHSLRALARRLRAGLRLFRRELAGAGVVDLGEQLGAWARELSAARDVDVWISWLSAPETAGFVTGHPAWPSFVAHEAHRLQARQRSAQDFLSGEGHAGLLADLDRFVGPVRMRGRFVVTPPMRARRKLRRLLRRLYAEKDPLNRDSLTRIHEFRRQCRRARYWAELLAPSLGRAGGRLREDLRELSDQLGLQRDADLAARRLSRRQGWWVDAVRHRARRISRRAGRRFNRQWRRFRRRQGEVEVLLG